MESVKRLIYGFVDIVGQKVKRFINCVIDIEDKCNVEFLILKDGEYIKQSIEDIELFESTPINGRLLIGKDVLSNTNLSVYKENTLVDTVVTSDEGYYNLYIKPGIYRLDINGGSYSQTINNYKFPKGLVSYSFIANGLIKSKNKDIIEFYDTEYVMVSGRIKNEDLLTEGTEIVISDEECKVCVYYEITKNGTYNFCLKPGIYDVRFRFKNKSVVIIEDFDFNVQQGFLDGINNKSNIFRGDKISWIFN